MSELLDQTIQDYFMRTRKDPDSLMKQPVQYPKDAEEGGKAGANPMEGGATPPSPEVPQVGGLNKDALTNFDARTSVPQLSTPPEEERPEHLQNLGKMLSHARAKRTMPQSPTS